jgi:aldose 1-epimerase
MRAGQLFEISSGNRQAVVTEQGAALFRVRWDGAELLNTANDDGFGVPGSHGQVLVPWPGRVSKGVYQYEGTLYQLMINDRQKGSAIHGWARWLTWQLKEHLADRITLSCRMLAIPGYPFPLEFEQSYAWQTDSLEISFIAKNIGDKTAPFGYGCHPYLSVGSSTINGDILQLPASRYFEANDDMSINVTPLAVEGTPFDFRQPKTVGGTELDVTLTALARDDEGKVVVVFQAPDGSISITCKYDEPIEFMQLFSGDTLPSGRRQGLAIEQYTCPPDAFNNGLGLIHLRPAASVRARWTLSA